jgi:ABC-type transport system substrate-binding protein
MLKRKTWALLAGLMLLSLVIAACQPQQVQVPVTVVQKETQVVQQTSVVVQTVVAPTEGPRPSFSTPHPILGVLENRQAIAYCSNRPEMIASVYPFIEDKSVLEMDTFIPKTHWAYTKPSESYAFDPEKGKALFEQAGWTLAEGADFRANAAGDPLSLKFTTTNAQFRQTWAAVFESNMADCGLQIVRFHVPASWWFGDTTGVARRDYELGAFAWVGQADPGGVSLYACDQIPTPENGWVGQNGMGWCNEKASVGIKLANNTLDRDERIAQYAIVQEEFAKDMVSLPLFNRAEVLATAADLQNFKPAPGEQYYTWNIHEWEIPGQDTIVIAFTQEPASMFRLVEDAYVAAIATNLVYGQAVTSSNYDFAAQLFKQLPTLENGGAVLNEVEVKAGDKVVDSKGDVVELAQGMKVRNAAGEEVEFDGSTPVTMQQLVVTATYLDTVMWSDGTPVVKADMELSDKINCDPESGATSFYICERTASIEYPDDHTASYTVVPGFLDPTYFADFVPGVYPSQRVLSDGRKLGDVPAKEWTTLPEIAESPIGIGPYKLVDWQKGQSMTFEANENFALGAPKTKSIVITFVADTNQAVAQLLTGDVDVVGSETLGAGAEVQTVIDASNEGKVQTFIEASATWEHIDMNLFVK